MLDPTLIRRDMTSAEVLAAMLPVVKSGRFAPEAIPPWHEHGRRISFQCGCDFIFGPEATWATIFASHVLPALMEMMLPYEEHPKLSTRAENLDAALTAFRDAWCAAAEAQTKETT